MTVELEKQGDVTVVTLVRPDVRNAVDGVTAQALHQAFVDFDQDDTARVAVLHGAHGHFCAGWNLKAGAEMARESAAHADALLSELDYASADARPLGPMGPSRLLLSKPVIAAIEGAAVAGGMELALWCDLRVMADDAYFGVYCRRFGVPLIDGGTVRLPRLIGQSRALDLILTGRRVDAPEALAIGLANRVVGAGQALDAAVAADRRLSARHLARRPPERAHAMGLAAGRGPAPRVDARQPAPGRRAAGRGALCRWRGPTWRVLMTATVLVAPQTGAALFCRSNAW